MWETICDAVASWSGLSHIIPQEQFPLDTEQSLNHAQDLLWRQATRISGPFTF